MVFPTIPRPLEPNNKEYKGNCADQIDCLMVDNMCNYGLCPNSVFDVVNSGGVGDDVGFGDGLFHGWDDERLVDGEAKVAVFR